MKVFAYQNPDEEIRRQSSSGGLFTALAHKILAEGGTVYGAAFSSDWRVKHIRVDNENDLQKLRGSKYVYSDFAGIIPEIVNDLNSGRKVLFSGTPCQVAAVSKRISSSDNLLLVEVVCHGAPEPRYWEKYLSALCARLKTDPSQIKSINFRDKSTGWSSYSYSIEFQDGTVFKQPHPDNLYFRAFIRNYTLRDACFKCPFKFPDNKGDIILGDFWGIDKILSEGNDNLGLNLCLAQTTKGIHFIKNILIGPEFDLDLILPLNKSLTDRAKKPADYMEFIEYLNKHNSIIKAFKKFAALSWRTKLNIKVAKFLGKFHK